MSENVRKFEMDNLVKVQCFDIILVPRVVA